MSRRGRNENEPDSGKYAKCFGEFIQLSREQKSKKYNVELSRNGKTIVNRFFQRLRVRLD